MQNRHSKAHLRFQTYFLLVHVRQIYIQFWLQGEIWLLTSHHRCWGISFQQSLHCLFKGIMMLTAKTSSKLWIREPLYGESIGDWYKSTCDTSQCWIPLTKGQYSSFQVIVMSCFCWYYWAEQCSDLHRARVSYGVSIVSIMERTDYFNSSPPGQNGCHFADDIFKCILMNKKFCISIQISLKFISEESNWQ